TKNCTTLATSSGVPFLFRGVACLIFSILSGCSSAALKPIGVSITPGEMVTMRAPLAPHLSAFFRLNNCTPRLAKLYMVSELPSTNWRTVSNEPGACGLASASSYCSFGGTTCAILDDNNTAEEPA